MQNKPIKEERMRRYFVDSCKELLLGESLRALSVRNVAERAGYSFATIYSYFKDLSDLTMTAVGEFLVELKNFVGIDSKGSDDVATITKSYIKYFVQYPSIYRLMFVEQISDARYHKTTLDAINSALGELLADGWSKLAEERGWSQSEAATRARAHDSMVGGMLLSYVNRRLPDDYFKFLENYDKAFRLFAK